MNPFHCSAASSVWKPLGTYRHLHGEMSLPRESTSSGPAKQIRHIRSSGSMSLASNEGLINSSSVSSSTYGDRGPIFADVLLIGRLCGGVLHVFGDCGAGKDHQAGHGGNDWTVISRTRTRIPYGRGRAGTWEPGRDPRTGLRRLVGRGDPGTRAYGQTKERCDPSSSITLFNSIPHFR